MNVVTKRRLRPIYRFIAPKTNATMRLLVPKPLKTEQHRYFCTVERPLHNRLDRASLVAKLDQESGERTTLSLYRYAQVANPQFLRDHLFAVWQPIGVLGRIYVSSEGINAQLSLPTHQLDAFKSSCEDIDWMNNIRLNIAIEGAPKSFLKLIVKVRDKIVADGLDDATFDVTDCGRHVSAKEFNELAEQQETVVVDMRNHYESEVGHFKGAILPAAETFRDEIREVEDLLADQKDQNIVLYCTGGIRCEKASAYLKHKGFPNVHQLEGGIIEYVRQVRSEGLSNRFKGVNFVFDERMAERVTEEVVSTCHQCGEASDDLTNCANAACNVLMVQCPNCAEKMNQTCSDGCLTFIALPQEQQKSKRSGQRSKRRTLKQPSEARKADD